MNGKLVLYIDQYGQKLWARTTRELRERAGGGRISKMYVDRAGETLHVGYVVGSRWFSAFQPVEKVALSG